MEIGQLLIEILMEIGPLGSSYKIRDREVLKRMQITSLQLYFLRNCYNYYKPCYQFNLTVGVNNKLN